LNLLVTIWREIIEDKVLIMTIYSHIAQGGASFPVKSYKSLFNGIVINPRFGILPLVVDGQYYTNPSISQGGNGFGADIVGILNFMTPTLSTIYVNTIFYVSL